MKFSTLILVSVLFFYSNVPASSLRQVRSVSNIHRSLSQDTPGRNVPRRDEIVTLSYEGEEDFELFMVLPNDLHDSNYNVRFSSEQTPFRLIGMQIALFNLWGACGEPGMEVSVWSSLGNHIPDIPLMTVDIPYENLIIPNGEEEWEYTEILFEDFQVDPVDFLEDLDFHIEVNVIQDDDSDSLAVLMGYPDNQPNDRSGLFLSENLSWNSFIDLGWPGYNFAIRAIVEYPGEAPFIMTGQRLMDCGCCEVDGEANNSINIYNYGNTNLTVMHPVVEGMYFSGDLADWASMVIPPGELLETWITCVPEVRGIHEGTFSIASDDPANPHILIPTRGVGVISESPYIEPDSDPPEFPGTAAGEFTEITLRLYNYGRDILRIDDISTTSPDHFEIFEGSADAQSAQLSIIEALNRYIADRNEEPESIFALIEEDYLEISEAILEQWEFRFIGTDPIKEIEAVSTASMKAGAGHVVMYKIVLGRFTGYGKFGPIELSAGQYYDLPLMFMPDEVREYGETLTILTNDPDREELSIDLSAIGLDPAFAGSNTEPGLAQNYKITGIFPNPFNSSTTITCKLASPADVSIQIYDIRGQWVDVLSDGRLQSGTHRFVWNGKNTAAGVYFASLKVKGGKFADMRKIVLLK